MRTLLTTATVVLALGAAACGSDDGERDSTVDAPAEAPARAMPCGEAEVYVWVDYEAGTAECVASTDHERHAGH